jgi:3'-phosphoadenosine 5'-phosphosulfate sulfotransferase (PAPS reductase)/FAD synthetase
MTCFSQAAFVFDPPALTEAEQVGPDLASYDRFVVAFSGGKDSLALVAVLLEAGVPREKIELWHHDVDGGGETFFDWACTPGYCRAVAEALQIPIYFSHKVGGLLGEMMRQDARTAPNAFEVPGGGWRQVGGARGELTTRLNWPAKAADLKTRWCSSYGKIDVMTAAINNQPRFLHGRTLVLTGERAEESKARSRYKAFEPHRADNRDGARISRHVDHWRPVHRWTEQQVWDAMRRLGIVPHPAYRLGWSRLSCMTCIFGSPHQWATIRAVFPARFALIAAREEMLGKTINFERRQQVAVQLSVHAVADRGRPYPAALAQPELVAVAESHEWIGGPVLTNDWQLPAGAFGEDAVGPT